MSLNSTDDRDVEEQFTKACDITRSSFIDSLTMSRILQTKFNVTHQQLEQTEIFENALLCNAQDFSTEVAEKITAKDVTGQARWFMKLQPYNEYIVIDYRSLSLEQRRLLAEAYKQKYKISILVVEDITRYSDFYTYNNSIKVEHGIMISISGLCKYVFPDLHRFMKS